MIEREKGYRESGAVGASSGADVCVCVCVCVCVWTALAAHSCSHEVLKATARLFRESPCTVQY